MALHFDRNEYNLRIQKTLAAMRDLKLDGLLMFSQESMYYLTSYDSFGFCFFQCLFLNADGKLVLLTRAPDLRQAKHTSTIEDIRIWADGDGVNPTRDLKIILEEFHCQNTFIGIEFDAYGLNGFNALRLVNTLDGFCKTTDASSIVKAIRAIKSDAEIAYVKKAAKLGDNALNAAENAIRPGAFEGDILAAMYGEVYKGGGESPGNENIIGSGDDALLCRSKAGRRHLDKIDHMTLEFAGVFHRYHAALMRTVCIGRATQEHIDMHRVCQEAVLKCREKMAPGNTMGDVFRAYAETCDKAGYQEHRLNATGYSLGATFAPTWMDYPMFYKDNPYIIQPNMTLFLHIILMNSRDKIAMTLGETYLVTISGAQCLSNASLDLTVKT